MSARALALVGMPGAGKTLCAKHLETLGFYQFRFGGIVVDEVARRGLPLNPANERTVREELRARHGMAAMAILALPNLTTALDSHQDIVIDGLYSFSEYKLLKQDLPAQLLVVAITCDRDLRYQRLTTRPERPLTVDEAQQRDFAEIEKLEKGGSIAIADYTLLNNGEPADLIAALDGLIGRLGFQP